MGVLRAEPARVTDWAQRSVGAVWRLYDMQLTVYAALLAGIGLAMAYTNSIEAGTSALEKSPGAVFGLSTETNMILLIVLRNLGADILLLLVSI